MEAYQNAALSPEERAKDLLGKMTLQEKVGQLNQRLYGFRIYERQGEEFTLTEEFKEEVERMGGLGVLYGLYRADPWADKDEKTGIVLELSAKAYNIVQKYVIDHSRLGIPMMMSTECPHGHQALGGGLLPVNLAAGATFDPELLSEGYKACGKQLKSGHVDLALMSALDMARDPRWGRSEECYSEDPCLAASMAKAAVTGMQSTGVGSVAKHFCAQGETTGGVNASAARIGERELREIHFPSAKACCEAGVEGIMAAYNEIDGVYCHRNAWLLRDVLRGEMGFDGIVMADGLAVDFLKNTEGDTLHAGVAARKAGVDVSLWDEAFSRLGEAVEQGLLDESEIDESVLKVLKLKFEKGLFEHPYMEENMLTPEEAGIPEVSLSLARESAVLLKNEESVLPLAKKYKKVAVIGYHAADRYCMLGDYTPPVPESECVTVLQGMKQEAPEGVEVSYAMGSEFSEADEDEKAKALALAARERCDRSCCRRFFFPFRRSCVRCKRCSIQGNRQPFDGLRRGNGHRKGSHPGSTGRTGCRACPPWQADGNRCDRRKSILHRGYRKCFECPSVCVLSGSDGRQGRCRDALRNHESVRPSPGIHAAPRRSDSGVLQLPYLRRSGILRYDEPAAAYVR